MVGMGCRHQGKRTFVNPFPEQYLNPESNVLQYLFCLEVHDPEVSVFRPHGENVFIPVHNSTLARDGTTEDFIWVFGIDDNDLLLAANILSYADEAVGFKGLFCVHERVRLELVQTRHALMFKIQGGGKLLENLHMCWGKWRSPRSRNEGVSTLLL